jgi:predicted metal-dependent hydrolase
MTELEFDKIRFKDRVGFWATSVRVVPTAIRVQKMYRKWASCSSSGWLSFNIDLLGEPVVFQDYVILHELVHLKHPNHGRLFKALLKAHLDFAKLSYRQYKDRYIFFVGQ